MTGTVRPRLLTPAQAAEALSIGKNTLQELIRRNEIRSIKVGTHLRRIPVEAIDEYISAREQESQ